MEGFDRKMFPKRKLDQAETPERSTLNSENRLRPEENLSREASRAGLDGVEKSLHNVAESTLKKIAHEVMDEVLIILGDKEHFIENHLEIGIEEYYDIRARRIFNLLWNHLSDEEQSAYSGEVSVFKEVKIRKSRQKLETAYGKRLGDEDARQIIIELLDEGYDPEDFKFTGFSGGKVEILPEESIKKFFGLKKEVLRPSKVFTQKEFRLCTDARIKEWKSVAENAARIKLKYEWEENFRLKLIDRIKESRIPVLG